MASIMMTPGGILPPEGVSANISNPESRANQLIISSAVCVTTALAFMLGRIYVKLRVLGSSKWGWDDTLCLLAMIGSIVYSTLCILATKAGLGKHMWDLGLAAFNAYFLQILFAVQISYVPVILVVKLSLFLLYLRVFHPYKWMAYCVWLGIVLNAGFYIAYAVYVGVLCSPAPGKTWDDLLLAQIVGENRCASTIQFAVIQSGVSIASDFYLLLLPLPAVIQLGLQPRKMVGVVSIFATGLLACGCSIIALPYRLKIKINGDITWDIVPSLVTLIIELNTAIICCCMPSIAILLRRQLDTPAATGASLSEKVLSQRSRQGPPPTAMQMKELEVGSQPDSDSIQKAERVHIVAETTVSIKSSRRSELESSHSPDLESGRPRPKISSPIPMRYDMHENEHNRPPSSSVCDDDSSQDRLVHSPEPFHRSANTSPGTPWQRLDWKDQQPPIHHTHERIQGMVRGQPTAMYSPRPRNSRAESPNWPLQ